MENYLPTDEENLIKWLKNFSSLLPETGKELGITVAEISSLDALIRDVKKDLIHQRSDEKKKENMTKFLYLIITKMKRHPSYTSSHGQKLGIE